MLQKRSQSKWGAASLRAELSGVVRALRKRAVRRENTAVTMGSRPVFWQAAPAFYGSSRMKVEPRAG